jgi:hypothetical protein
MLALLELSPWARIPFQDTDRDAITPLGGHCDPVDTVGTSSRLGESAPAVSFTGGSGALRLAQTHTKVLSVPLSNCLQSAVMA